jgi:glycosyltransferase involved in cell wall biosynthesis
VSSPQTLTPLPSQITIVEHFDPEKIVPSGIDSVISGLINYSPPNTFRIVGITSNRRRTLGQWTDVRIGGHLVPFLPVAKFDRQAKKGFSRVIPHSALFAVGLVRFRRSLASRGSLHSHRIETGRVLLSLSRLPLVQFIHNDSSGLLGSDSDSVWRHLGPIYRALERGVFAKARSVAIFNETDAERIRKVRPDVRVCKTWFDPELFHYQPKASSPASPDSALTISWVGRMDAQKDPILAIRTVAALGAFAKVQLVMMGSGALEPDVKKLVEELGLSNVELTGAIPRSQVADRVRHSDVMLMTSHYEGSPTVLIEAGAVGTPVVATSGADPDTSLRDGLNGIRVESRSPDDLAVAIVNARNILAEDCARASESRSARTLVPRLLEL